MKNIKLLILAVIACSVMSVKAQSSANGFRNQILNYIKGEGYTPYIDNSDNSVTFKKEGVLFWVSVHDESSPFYVRFHRSGLDYSINTDRMFALEAANKMNYSYKAVRVTCQNNEVAFEIDSYFTQISEFQNLFTHYVNILNEGAKDCKTYFNQFDDDGFVLSRCNVANTEKSGTIINDYGSDIVSSKTKYIQPRIWIYSKENKTCTIYVKFVTPSGLSTSSSSPEGYTYKNTLNLLQGYHCYDFSGWGADNYGQWAAGEYNLSFYYDDHSLNEISFTIQ